MKKYVLNVLFVLLLCSFSHASFLDALQERLDVASTPRTGDGKIDLGLKEVLNVGVKNSIKYLGKNNGYFGNKTVKFC